VTARGQLRFERAGEGTALAAAYAESPLRLLTPRRSGEAACALTSTLGGGLLDGDRIALDIEVGERALALVSSQGPTRVFRGACASETRARVAASGALMLLPDPYACFRGARFAQSTHVELEPGASLLFWDVLSAGRDRWDFASCRTALSVRRGGRALIDEAWLLDQAHGAVQARLGRFGALATLLAAGPRFAGLRCEPRPVGREIEAVSPLGADAFVLRVAAPTTEEALAAVRLRVEPLRSLLGDYPWRRDASVAA